MRNLLSCVFSAFLILGLAITSALPARAGETLTVYTYESFISDWGPGPAIKKSFEAECDCQVNWVGIQDGVAILNRLKLEGPSSAADIVLGLDTNLTAEARDTGLFADHGVSLVDVSLPIDWQDDVFVPYDYAHFAVVYDRDRIATPPASLKELVEGGEGKIVIEDPRTSTPGLGLLLWMKSVYGDDAAKAWAQLKPRVLTVTPGWSEAYGLFTKGEAEMVLSYTTSPAYHQIAEQSQKYAAASFAEGHYLQVEVAAMLKGATHPELARRFLSFMTGPGFQDHIPLNNWMFPAGKTSTPLPDEFDRLVKPVKTLLYSPEVVAANRRAWTDEWLDVMSQ